MGMTSNELREQFLNFFESKGHKRLPSASLVPKDDSSVLFTSAGMQQFRKFYGSPNEAPAAAIATCQKCIRTSDIDEVGDTTHLTFFEMLGNFSFGYPKKEGSYFKKEAIAYAWEFLTEILKVEKERLTATYFKGEDDIPADEESLKILKEVTGLADDKITGTGKDETFWSLGSEGSPGGPTVEFYIDGVEIWNLVFNQYVMKDGRYIPSEFCGVDTGMGLERLAATIQGKNDVFETDLFAPIITKIEELSGKKYQENQKAFRVIADHLKAAVFLSSEGILPSNINQGYINRRLIRRAVRYAKILNIKNLLEIISSVIAVYSDALSERKNEIEKIISDEEIKFEKTLADGLKKAEEIFSKKTPVNEEIYTKIMQVDEKGEVLKKIYHGGEDMPDEFPKLGIEITNKAIRDAYINGEEAFYLYQTYGFPIEMIMELAQAKNLFVTFTDFRKEVEKHQEKSRTASAGMFKGGLADAGEETTKLHTAAHLMLAAMREVLGPDVNQKGSNITAERLRFDFNYPEKLTDEQIKKIEEIVNKNIAADLPVKVEEMSVAEAKSSGATGVFDERYGDKVKVYTIGIDDNIGNASSTRSARSGSQNFVSREICGGPHVTHTGELGHFKITKEESSSAGVRRVKAVLE